MITEDARRIANELWKKGTACASKKDFGYAVAFFSEAVKRVPDDLRYRQCLRGSEYRLYQDNGIGRRFAWLKLRGIRSRVMSARAKQDWDAVDQEAEKGLATAPWNAQLEACVGEACDRRGYRDVAFFSYFNATKNDPNNLDPWRTFADFCERHDYLDEAIRAWERIRELEVA